ncbi:MAG: addiction module protein [Verrucomicrobiaceae bacterium]
MTATYDTVLQDALSLSLEERSRIATRLIESVDDDDIELSPAWQAEIERRIEDMRSGKSRRIPHEEVMAEMRELIVNLK